MKQRIAALCLGLSLVAPAPAEPPPPDLRPQRIPAKRNMKDARDDLQLSPDQLKQMEALGTFFKEQAKALSDRQLAVEAEITRLSDANAELTVLEGKVRESEMLRVQVLYLDAVMAGRVESILTPEQVKKWKKAR